jgi:hypothetical protein
MIPNLHICQYLKDSGGISREPYFCLQYKYLHFCQCIIADTVTQCIIFLGHGLTVWFGNMLLLLHVVIEVVTLLL